VIDIVPFDVARAADIVTVWRLSKERALAPYREHHSVAEQLAFLTEVLPKRAIIDVAIDAANDRIAGFMAQAGESIEQLYLHPDYQRQGLGSRLLEIAKSRSPKRLHLYTFQRNLPAQAFYLRHGFREIGRGVAADEGLPDIEYVWEIGDSYLFRASDTGDGTPPD